jgi:outer membrane protein assembly factor BamB
MGLPIADMRQERNGRAGRTVSLLLAAVAVVFAGADWRQFRGSENTGVSAETNHLPVSFATNHDLAWKVPLPGRGASGPIVVGDRVVVTCSSGARQERLHLLCFAAADGKCLWHREFWATGNTLTHEITAVAIPTPASDGRRIFAFYSSNDLACVDLDGNLLWYRGLGYEHPSTRNAVGMSSSPLVIDDTVIVQLDSPGQALVAAIDAGSGATRWQIGREANAAFSSPTLFGGCALVQGKTSLVALDPRGGQVRWKYDYDVPYQPVASVATWHDTVFVPGMKLSALRPGAAGEEPKLLWAETRFRPEMASPIVYDGKLYVLKSGILACGDAATGRTQWQLRLKGAFWASPVLADGRLYCVNRDGLVQVVQLGKQGKLLATSQIDDGISASPAVAQGAVYFRSDRHLWKIGNP